ncbi:hypothetical protein COU74_00445 [Candidatus Peregrinibacteria bacterium CG10_big_fil_rev_8_21_14_0_10_36_19]|nr:MAG: hypothetical protein COU74_00445 [Candidatus Peregrinibacteria bacterium CG10_big_fil_rev_8_21_14_0_10_36_19]
MENYLVQKKRQEMQIKSYLGITLLVVISMGFYTFSNWKEFSAVKKLLVANANYISALKNEVVDEKANYDGEKFNFDALNKEIETKLESIFPLGNQYTELTKQVDVFEEDLSTKNSVFEVSNIDYQEVEKGEFYSILPMRMTIRSSSANFTKFLHWVENSGALSDRVRLMDITSIRLNFQEEENRDEIISFTVQMNAYFQ